MTTNIINFADALAAREPRDPCPQRGEAEVIDYAEVRLNCGLMSVPVTYLDHIDNLTTVAHTIFFRAIDASPMIEHDVPVAGADADLLIDAADDLPRKEPTDAEETRELREHIAAMQAAVEKVWPWIEQGFRDGTVLRIEAEEARDEALRLMGRLETFGVDLEKGLEIEKQWGGPPLLVLLLAQKAERAKVAEEALQ